jgi:transcriptional regulator with XRE-family HTH domain
MTAAATQVQPTSLLHQQVASNIRAERARSNISQARMAEVLGIAQQNVSAKLRGVRAFTLDEIGILAPLFGMTPAELIAGVRFGSVPPQGPLAQSAELRTFNP